MSNTPKIYKTNGDLVPFDRDKVKESLLRSGSNEDLAENVVKKVEGRVEDKMSTTDIYRIAFDLLKEMKQRPQAAKYSLKRSIMQLGPSGFPFERFVGEVLSRQGYDTEVGVEMDGVCTFHEVDVVANNDKRHNLIECKFHNKTGIKTDVKVPLYIHSRFKDLKKKKEAIGDTDAFHRPWVVTNTRFTKSAIEYGECMNMKLIGWRYPEEGGLEKLVEDTGLQPLTCLTTLTDDQKNKLLENELVLCKDLIDNQEQLAIAGVDSKKIDKVLTEAQGVCGKK